MKTFFYTVVSPNCADDCNLKTCSKRYFSRLQGLEDGAVFHPIVGPIDPNVHEISPVPQLGDIVVLFVQNDAELTIMNRSCDCFDGMKKLLVVGDSSGIDGSMYHKLSPRYITQAGRAVEELGQVIEKMKTPIKRMS